MQNPYRLLNRAEAAEYLGISTTVLDRLTRAGHIAYIETPSTGKAGRPCHRWTVGDLNAYIDSNRKTAVPQTPAAVKGKRKRPVSAESAAAILKGGKR